MEASNIKIGNLRRLIKTERDIKEAEEAIEKANAHLDALRKANDEIRQAFVVDNFQGEQEKESEFILDDNHFGTLKVKVYINGAYNSVSIDPIAIVRNT